MYSVSIKNSVFEVEKSKETVAVNGNILDWDISEIRTGHYHVLHNNQSFNLELVSLDAETKTVKLKLNNKLCEVTIKDKFDLLLEKLGMNNLKSQTAKEIKAPMPGLIFDIKVKEGDEVKKGQVLMVVEAMKMENVLFAANDCVVSKVLANKGESLSVDQPIIEFV